jgi:hypothetical protein
MKVYAEHGALRDELYALERAGKVQLVTFPYESKSKKIRGRALPSAAQLGDLGHVTIGEMNFPLGEFSPSPTYARTVEIVGSRNRRDALHIDSAYKSACVAFFSRDRKDIISRRDALEPLLGIRFFHPDDDWQAFLEFLEIA